MFVGFLVVEQMIGSDHVIDYVGFADFFRAELLRGTEILAVVISQMIVGNDRLQFETRRDEEIGENGFQFRLSTLEIITANEDMMLVGKSDDTRHQRVLRAAIDVRTLLENRCTREYVRWTDFLVVVGNRLKNLFARHVQSSTN